MKTDKQSIINKMMFFCKNKSDTKEVVVRETHKTTRVEAIAALKDYIKRGQ